MKRLNRITTSICLAIMTPLSAAAKCGSVDYSLGAGALANMHDYVVTVMLYVLYLCYAIAALMVIISAFQIYVKMMTGEDGIVKAILTIVGACLFMISAGIIYPALFGYEI